MNVLLAGAFGNLGSDVLRELVRQGHTVTAVGRTIRKPEDCQEGYTAVEADLQKPEQLKGICNGMDIVITTVGLTRGDGTLTNKDIDYRANLNLLKEARRAKVKTFVYVSVVKVEGHPDVPMLAAKAAFERMLKKSGLNWVIFRPTGYFYDISQVFMPMIDKGKVTLLGKKPVYANVVHTPDLARFMVAHMNDKCVTYDVGGVETWSYEEIAKMFFKAAGKEPNIGYAPAKLFDLLIFINKRKKNGKADIIKFSKFTLSEDMIGDNIAGDSSFEEYIKSLYK